MKRFIKGIVEWKSYACMMFTGAVCVYGVIAWGMGETTVRLGLLLQLLVVSLIGTLIQGIAFSEDWLIRNMAYAKRMILFVALFLPALTGFALLFRWFPTDRALSWGIFLLIFLAIFLAMVAGFELVFQITGKKYSGLLGQYKKKKGEET